MTDQLTQLMAERLADDELKKQFSQNLRDQFAMAAMQALLQSQSIEFSDVVRVSMISYKIADAMLKQRNESP